MGKIVVTTPTGNIGSGLVKELLEAGAEVAVIARNPDRLSEAVRAGARVYQGNQMDQALLTEATRGASALFWLTPSDITVPDTRAFFEQAGHAVATAVRANSIPHVVNLSSAGAHRASGAGPVSLLQIVENALNDTSANVVHLRPGFFFENFLEQAEAIATAGSLFLPMPGSRQMPMIATRDISAVAAKLLLNRSWTGRAYQGLHGPKDLTFDEVAATIGEALGRPVRYTQIPVEQVRQMFLDMGSSEDFADVYAEMVTAFRDISQLTAEPRTPETTTPTTLREWARETLPHALQSVTQKV